MAIETTDTDEQALILRGQSKGFGKIAEALGFERPSEANEAFNRALRRHSPDEQVTIRAEENRRLDRLAAAASADDTGGPEAIEKRLHAVDRLRSRLMTD
jgi:hypothetical protein